MEMKKKLHVFAIRHTATILQRTDYLNPRIRRYPVLDGSNWMKPAYFTIIWVKILLKMVAN